MRNKALYVTATGVASGKSAVSLGLMRMLMRGMGKVAIFRPIINEPQGDERDPDISLMLDLFKLNMDYRETFAYTQQEARAVINQGSRNLLLENIIQRFKKLLEKFDFVLCIGTDFQGRDPVFEFELNAEIAANLGAPVVLVANVENATETDIAESLLITRASLQSYSLDVLAVILNRASLSSTGLAGLRANLNRAGMSSLIYAIPGEPALAHATLNDVAQRLDAKILSGANRLDVFYEDYLVAAMQVDNFLARVSPAQLIITPGDRSDIILAALASSLSTTMPRPAGLLLTGGIPLAESVRKLLEGWTGEPLPILLTGDNTYEAIARLRYIQGMIAPGDSRKIEALHELFDRNVDTAEIEKRLLEERSDNRMPPLMFEFELIERAKREKQRIVLCEGADERILRATDILLRREVAEIILLGNIEAIKARATSLNLDISRARLINPVESPQFPDYVKTYYEYRKAKGITEEQARDLMSDSTYYGTMMVKLNDADGMVSGAINTTAHTIRPAFEFIKTKPGISIVSSVFLMCLKDKVLVFGDCAVNPNPTAQQLAEIAIASAHTAKVFGIVPRVAMLSYSTGSSGKGPDVDLVIEATKIAKAMAPDLALEGPLQYDAAIDPVVAMTKLPGSQVAGKATVFIFPDLNTGNNTYKAVQRAGEAIAIGPVLQGLKMPVNDLSRGCLVPDIVNTVAITAVQAAADKQARQNQA